MRCRTTRSTLGMLALLLVAATLGVVAQEPRSDPPAGPPQAPETGPLVPQNWLTLQPAAPQTLLLGEVPPGVTLRLADVPPSGVVLAPQRAAFAVPEQTGTEPPPLQARDDLAHAGRWQPSSAASVWHSADEAAPPSAASVGNR